MMYTPLRIQYETKHKFLTFFRWAKVHCPENAYTNVCNDDDEEDDSDKDVIIEILPIFSGEDPKRSLHLNHQVAPAVLLSAPIAGLLCKHEGFEGFNFLYFPDYYM